MENLFQSLHSQGKTLATATSHRLSKPSLSQKSGMFEDLGSSFKPQTNATKSKFKPATTRVGASSARRVTPERERAGSSRFAEEGSPDQLDCISAMSENFSPSKEGSQSNYIDPQGKAHAYHKDFKPKSALSALKFKKIKQPDAIQEDNAPSASDKSRFLSKENAVAKPLLLGKASNAKPSVVDLDDSDDDEDVNPPLKSSNRHTTPPRKPSASVIPKPTKTTTAGPSKPPNALKSTESTTTTSNIPRPRPLLTKKPGMSTSTSTPAPTQTQTRPQPRSHKRTGAGSLLLIPSPKKEAPKQREPSIEIVIPTTTTTTTTRPKPRPIPKPVPKPTPQEFPVSPPLTINPPTKEPTRPIAAFLPISPILGAEQKRKPVLRELSLPSPLGSPTPQRPHAKEREIAAFPDISPIAGEEKRKPKLRDFSLPSPLSGRAKGKGKMRARSVTVSSGEGEQDSDEEVGVLPVLVKKGKDGKGRGKVKVKTRAFPMSTQALQSIKSSRDSPVLGKRFSEDGSEGGDPKRTKRDLDATFTFPSKPFEDEGDSYLNDTLTDADPNTLCPYCDTPLPPTPTPTLLKLLSHTATKSRPDPRPGNILGRKAPLPVFIATCQRHRFESQILPKAEKNGWPKSIKWEEVPGRIGKMRGVIGGLIFGQGEGGRAGCMFWREVMEEVRTKGVRGIMGVRAQFSSFEKEQAGYYGEQGAVIIHQTLYDMFAPDTIDSEFVAPLTTNDFFSRILAPEIAARLIMEDLSLSGEEGMKEAVRVMRESSTYGVAMFPEDGGEWGDDDDARGRGRKKNRNNNKNGKKMKSGEGEGVVGVGDLIVMERARKRRKELEEEQEKEDALAVEREWMMVEEVPVQPSRPKPRPIHKSASSMDLVHEEAIATTAATTTTTTNARQKLSRGSDYDTEPNGDSAIEITDSESGGRRTRRRGRSRAPSVKPPSSSTGFAELRIKSDDEAPMSDSSTRAIVQSSRGGGRKGKGETKPKPVAASTKGNGWGRMVVDGKTDDDDDDDDNDNDVVILEDTMKTPVPNRNLRKKTPSITTIEDNEDTPKPARWDMDDGDLPPLQRARLRKEQSALKVGEQGGSKTKRPKSRAPDRGSGGWSYSMRDGGPSDASSDASGASSTRAKATQKEYKWLLSSSESSVPDAQGASTKGGRKRR